MALEIGSRLSHYDVTVLIGDGGMERSLMEPDQHRIRLGEMTGAR